MSISGLSSGIPTVEEPVSYQGVGNSELDKQDFLTLFITQLKHQDPLQPMNSYEMASQLAQFSSLAATMDMSDNIERLLDYQTSQNNLQLLTLLDKEVQALGNGIGVTDGKVGRGIFTLVEGSDNVEVKIYDSRNRQVRLLDLGAMEVGEFELTWDGEDARGDTVDDGLYSYVVKAQNSYGEPVEVDYRMVGTVTGVQFDSGAAIITLDNQVSVNVGDVVQVLEKPVEE